MNLLQSRRPRDLNGNDHLRRHLPDSARTLYEKFGLSVLDFIDLSDLDAVRKRPIRPETRLMS